ncbi:hypothetical protein [Parendozoicomonas sp. Alg238-R29]|uniref:DUF7281 domain-containing protein n=1 Tax=Parendozoicomonas sp. Alg238-R29 TaxID=2993446 RepID=UPI00248E9D81|nr:hypothetical protein [Parendozoicomonas sp. Alg238-R29]
MNEKSLQKQIRLLSRLLSEGGLNDSEWNKGSGFHLREDMKVCGLIQYESQSQWVIRTDQKNSVEDRLKALQEQLAYFKKTANSTNKAKGSDQVPTSTHKYYLLNTWKTCHWYHLDNPEDKIELHQLCQFSGPISLTFHPEDDLACDQPLALIENIEPLHYPEQMLGRENFGCLLYYKGQLADSLLRWLTFRQRAPEVWLFPDYDYVGLANYLRLKEHLPQARLFVPENIETLLKSRQGSSQRAVDQFPYANLEKLQKSSDKDIQRILKAIKQTGKTLNQETLLIPA